MYTVGVCLAVSDSALYLATFRESGTEASWDGRASSKKGSPRPTGTVLLDDQYFLSCPYDDLHLYGRVLRWRQITGAGCQAYAQESDSGNTARQVDRCLQIVGFIISVYDRKGNDSLC